ncbi:hypothetical protein [Rubrivirga sp. IMCC45206]|uniref:hypothetical protein n=1 Tax=Rubrivirga sp. IMCC45206 TaxID=3391614 RepID=UPI00398FC0E4
MSRLALALAVALSAPAALAQIVPPEAESAPDSVATAPSFAQDVVREAAQRARPSPRLGLALRAATQPTVETIRELGVTVTLPPGWRGPAVPSAQNSGRYAVFTLRNAAPRHPLAGAVVRVERVVGFEGVERERWLRGQTPYRYHGSAGPVGPIAVPGHPFGVEVAGGGVRGAVVFVRTHGAIWAIGVEAPEALWARQQAALLALVNGVRLP